MKAPEALIRRYFRPFQASPWRWSADGQTVVTLDGTTIAFREEICELSSRCLAKRLPPFGSIVLLLMACHEQWRDKADLKEYAVGVLNFAFREKEVSLDELLNPMNTVGALPTQHRLGLDAKAHLFLSVFDESNAILDEAYSQALLAELKAGIPPEWLHPREQEGASELVLELTALRPAMALTPERLEQRRKTGLDTDIETPDLDLPDALLVRNLLATLKDDDDPELAGLARIALNLLAAVHIPRPLLHEDEMPLGGYTDIVNRGSLDRLLMSELAHDDLTLSVRVALNEALYLRRESPPQNPQVNRTILIDSGIRMWGLPRVYGIAAALAFAASATPQTRLSVYRANQSKLEPVILTSREGISAHLAALEPEPHPALALETLFMTSEHSEVRSELTLVTHRDVFQDPEFRRSLHAKADLFVATVTGDGDFELLEAGAHGHKRICMAQMDLESILERPAKLPVEKLRRPVFDGSLPLVLSMDPFPLRVPHKLVDNQYGFSKQLRLFAVSKDGRLTWWQDPNLAPKLLSTAVPSGQILKVIVLESAVLILIHQQQKEKQLLLFNWDMLNRKHTLFPLLTEGGLPLHCEVTSGVLALIYSSRIETYNLNSGVRTGSLKLDNANWKHGRYFKDGMDWHVLDCTGGEAHLIPLKASAKFGVSMVLIDRDGVEGPWCLDSDGIFTSIANASSVKFQLDQRILRIVSISQDGHRIVVRFFGVPEGKTYLLDASSGQCTQINPQSAHWIRNGLEPEIAAYFAKPHSLRTAIVAMQITRKGSIVLLSRKDSAAELTLSKFSHMILRTTNAISDQRIPFKNVRLPKGTRFQLAMAELGNGNRVFLDSRGILHLVPKEGLQISMLLHDSHVTAWRSDGSVCTDVTFQHEGNEIDDKAMFNSICAFGVDSQ